jgi:hypothetical protein
METPNEDAAATRRKTVNASEARRDSEHGGRVGGDTRTPSDLGRTFAAQLRQEAAEYEKAARKLRDAADHWETKALWWEAIQIGQGKRRG